jgi:curved DNA-binding protein CbpA
MAARPTFYEILNVSPSAEPVVIEAAYRALMKRYHPDQGTGAVEGRSPTAINAAYAVLKDPERRARYDEREWARQQSVAIAHYAPPPPPSPPRGMHLFGWSGWAVALGLGGFVAATGGQLIEKQPLRPEPARTAAAVPAVQGSQPDTPVSPGIAAISDNEYRILSAAVEAEQRADARAAAVDERVPDPVPAPIDLREKPRRTEGRAAERPATKPKAAGQARRSEEKDFLEREGYIY